jgi:stage IV sporulation protein FB
MVRGDGMSRGWWTLGHFRGAPIRLHWTLPLGAFAMGRFAFVPAFWLGFAVLILIHELGHALFVVRYRLGLSEIAVHGFGGYCRHTHSGTRAQEAAVAWGGVLAQLAAFVVAQALLFVLGPPASHHWAQLAYVFTGTNLWIMAFNLLPIEPLDGAKAWPLVGMWWQRRGRNTAARTAWGQKSTVSRELRNLEKPPVGEETPEQRTERIVREMIARTTQSKDR